MKTPIKTDTIIHGHDVVVDHLHTQLYVYVGDLQIIIEKGEGRKKVVDIVLVDTSNPDYPVDLQTIEVELPSGSRSNGRRRSR